MECNQALPLIPSYLDGELSEARAAPLRKHLLDCQPCRAGAQGEKNFKRWFAAEIPGVIPQGFAARVARRAFAGDTGETPLEAAEFAGGVRTEAPLLRFVLQITATAALLVVTLSVALRSLSLPAGASLRAADGRDEISVEEALERLDQLNREEKAVVPAAQGRRP